MTSSMVDVKGKKVVKGIDSTILELEKISRTDQTFAGFYLSNATFGINMNVDPGTTGTPDVMYDGGDTTEWTPTNLTGSNFDFTSTTHARQGISTVVDYTALSGARVTVGGTNMDTNILEEGIQWTASTDNATTATSLAAALASIDGIDSATAATSNVVNLLADLSLDVDITTFTSDDATNLPTSAQSVDATATVNADQMLLTAPATVDMSDIETIAGAIYIDLWNSSLLHEITLQFCLAGTLVGVSVALSDFVNKGSTGEWLLFSIPRTQFEITDETIDEFIVTTVNTGPGDPPDYFLDYLRLEESGGGVTFSFTPDAGTVFIADKLTIIWVAPGKPDLENVPPDVLPSLAYNKFITLSELPIGIVTLFVEDGVPAVGALVRHNGDLLGLPQAQISPVWYDNVNDCTWYQWIQPILITQDGDLGDSFELIVSDDLSSLKLFTAFYNGQVNKNV